MNILFLCTANINRSKTAEDHFSKIDSCNAYRSVGLNEKLCKKNGSTLCSVELSGWADRVYVMEQRHIEMIELHTQGQFTDKISNLEIEDVYEYMDEELVFLLTKKCGY